MYTITWVYWILKSKQGDEMATNVAAMSYRERRTYRFHQKVAVVSTALTAAMVPLGLSGLVLGEFGFVLVASAYLALEVIWCLALGVMGVGYGLKFWAGVKLSLEDSQREKLFISMAPNRTVWAGFYLNVGAGVLQELVLLGGILFLTPAKSWPLLLLVPLFMTVLMAFRIASWLYLMNTGAGKVRVWPVEAADVDAYAGIQKDAWGDAMSAERDKLWSRFNIYPEGILVARQFGQPVGMVTTILLLEYNEDDPPSWDEITDQGRCTTHEPSGRIMYGVDMSVASGTPEGVHNRLLLACMGKIIREDLECGILGGRMPGYHQHASEMSAEEYLWKTRESDGRPFDWQVRMYTGVPGVRVLKAIPDYFEDPESLNWGVLLRWSNPFCSTVNRRWYNWPLYNRFTRSTLAYLVPLIADWQIKLSERKQG